MVPYIVVEPPPARAYLSCSISTGDTDAMTTFDSREAAFENKFAHDAEQEFQVSARRNKLLGMWAAKLMGLTAAETDSYAKSVIQADFEEPGDEDVVRKVLGDLTAANTGTSEAQVRAQMAALQAEAKRQIGAL
jgi:hypothetical protein